MNKNILAPVELEVKLHDRWLNLVEVTKRSKASLVREAVEDIIKKYVKKQQRKVDKAVAKIEGKK